MIESTTDSWTPPSRNGLSNSEPILPSYYLKKIKFIYNDEEYEAKYMNVDYLSVIKDDIRNMRPLNKFKLSFIKYELDHETKNELIELMNECIAAIGQLVMNS